MRFILWSLARVPVLASAAVNGAFYFVLAGGALELTPSAILAGVFAAGLFVADVMKPEMFRRGRGLLLKLAGVFLVLVSIAAGVGMVAGERIGSAVQASTAQTEVREIRSALSALKEKESSESLRMQASAKARMAEREGRRGRCGPVCENLHMQSVELTRRAGIAERRERLEAKLEAETPKAKPKDAFVGFLRERGFSLSEASLLPSLLMILALEIAACVCPNLVPVAGGGGKPKPPTREEVKAQAEALARRGLKQIEIADRLKVSQGYVSKMLAEQRGAKSKPKLRVVR